MGTEIERKYLVSGDGWHTGNPGHQVDQGYSHKNHDCTPRVRTVDQTGYFTLKGPRQGISRKEYEFEIPFPDARALLAQICAQPPVEKTRYRVEHQGHLWEVDEFHGANAGLLMAEIELEAEDETFVLPDWAGEEVSRDMRYTNYYLSTKPYSTWKEP